MTLQNRVDPWGQLHAVAERGTMLGNRGGRFHRHDQTLGKRRWASHHWICCELHYKGLHHEAMGKGYTSLFFLDEVTALAAGHRPCFFCRRAEARAFLGEARVEVFDRQLHGERTAGPHPLDGGPLPDGAMLEFENRAYAVKGGRLLLWSFASYTPSNLRIAALRAKLLTPPSILRILRQGYQPRWHESATQGDAP
jgi:hypothetical protein